MDVMSSDSVRMRSKGTPYHAIPQMTAGVGQGADDDQDPAAAEPDREPNLEWQVLGWGGDELGLGHGGEGASRPPTQPSLALHSEAPISPAPLVDFACQPRSETGL